MQKKSRRNYAVQVITMPVLQQIYNPDIVFTMLAGMNTCIVCLSHLRSMQCFSGQESASWFKNTSMQRDKDDVVLYNSNNNATTKRTITTSSSERKG
jgi:hypothetical protein